MTATTTWRSAAVSDSDRQAFDCRREQIARYLPDPGKTWRWSWLQGRIDQQVLERARQRGYIEQLSEVEGAWRVEQEAKWWRVSPEWYLWCRDRYGCNEEQGPGVEMLADPAETGTSDPVPLACNDPPKSIPSNLDGEYGDQVDEEILSRTEAKKEKRRAACASHLKELDPAECTGQLTVDQAFAVADTRQVWRESGVTLTRPRGDAYPETPAPSHIDAATG